MKLPKILHSITFSEDVKQSELTKITTSADAERVLRKCFDKSTFFMQEQFIILMLNTAGKVIGYYPLSSGGLTGTVVDVRLIFSTAIKTFASSIILSHNHPSGSLKPSDQDKAITKKIKDAGTLLDIRLIDHLILTDESYFSFGDEGEL